MKPRKSNGQIKINPKVKKQLYSGKETERVVFKKVIIYPKAKSPIKAIRAKCLWCCGDSSNEVKLCNIQSCVLWEFRLGKNPYHTRDLSEEQKDILRENIKKAHAAREEKKSAGRRRIII